MNLYEAIYKMQWLDASINEILKEISSVRESAYRLSGSSLSERVSGSRVAAAPFEAAIQRAELMRGKANKYTDELVDLRKAVAEAIFELEDHKERIVMRERHVNGKSWSGIAESTGWSERTIYRIHRSAMENSKKIFILSVSGS